MTMNSGDKKQTSFEMLLGLGRKLRRMTEGRLLADEEPLTMVEIQEELSALEERMREGSRTGFFRVSMELLEQMFVLPEGLKLIGFQRDRKDNEHNTISVLIMGEPLPSLPEGQLITEVSLTLESVTNLAEMDNLGTMRPYRLAEIVRVGSLAGDSEILCKRPIAEEE